MKVIDFHSHVLPCIDDGSKDIETSIEMLKKSKASGVDLMVATPHFYADCDRIERFLEKREHAYRSIEKQLTEETPDLLLGAEVAFFEGIGHAERVRELTIDGSDVLLLEMPFRPWRQSDIDEVKELIEKRKLRILIAHLERFLYTRGNKPYVAELMHLPVTIQINAESLTDRHMSRKLIKMFQKGQAHILGSDCHGIHHRPPNLMEGRWALKKKAGADVLQRVDEAGMRLLGL